MAKRTSRGQSGPEPTLRLDEKDRWIPEPGGEARFFAELREQMARLRAAEAAFVADPNCPLPEGPRFLQFLAWYRGLDPGYRPSMADLQWLKLLEEQERRARMQPPQQAAGAGTPAELDGPSRALALLVLHPDWTAAKIAEQLGISRTTLYRAPYAEFRKARRAMRGPVGRIPRGRKSATGDLEAWSDD